MADAQKNRSGSPVLKGRQKIQGTRPNQPAAHNALKTKITYQTGTTSQGDTVGTRMSGTVGPDHPAGTRPQRSAHLKTFKHLSNSYAANTFKRGHLLNGHLGGPGSKENLYPITTQANAQHYVNVEQYVQTWVNTHGYYVHYEVDVDRTVGWAADDADFDCIAYPLGADGNQAVGSDRIDVTVQSRAAGGGATVGIAAPYNAGAAYSETSPNAAIEYQKGSLPAGFVELTDTKMNHIEDIMEDHLTRGAHVDVMISEFRRLLAHQGTNVSENKYHDWLETYVWSEDVPADLQPAQLGSWNTLFNALNQVDFDEIKLGMKQKADTLSSRNKRTRR